MGAYSSGSRFRTKLSYDKSVNKYSEVTSSTHRPILYHIFWGTPFRELTTFSSIWEYTSESAIKRTYMCTTSHT